jgi:hypothetical protein
MRCAVIIMAKAPVPGFAKTRLIPALGAEAAASLAERLLHHALQQALLARVGPVELCVAPDPAHPAFASLRTTPRVSWTEQGRGDLGERMNRAFARTLGGGAAGALLIGTDAPGLDADALRRAAAELATHDAVFVPALDGGYALVGLRRTAPHLFDAMPWSTSAVMAETRERAFGAGMKIAELAPVADIDEPQDLVHVPAGWLR